MTVMTVQRPPRDNLVRAVSRAPELVRADGDDATAMPTLTGHFSVFDRWTEIHSGWEGNFMERIARGAFKKTFQENRANMRVLFNHGQDFSIGDKVLGPIRELKEDAEGAYYEVPLLDTSYNRDLVPALEAGLYGASFRFRVVREEFVAKPEVSADNPKGIPERTVKEASVMEFGPVTFPAYKDATAGLRSDAIRSLTDEYAFGQLVRDPDKLAALLGQSRMSADDTTSGDGPAAATEGDGAEAEPHSDDEGDRGQESEDQSDSGDDSAEEVEERSEDTTSQGTQETRNTMPATKTIEELRSRDADIQARFAEIHAEHGASVLPEEVRQEWDNLIAERNSGRQAIADYEARTAQLALMGDSARNQEVAVLPQPGAPNVRRTRGVPSNVHAIEEYRSLAGSMDELRAGYRDGARAIIERMTLAHPSADENATKQRMQRMLETIDDEYGVLAQRFIITTGPIYQRAFDKALKGRALTSEESRALSLGSDADGGYAVPVQLDPTVLLTSSGVINPIRSIARVETILGKEWQGLTSDGVTVTRTTEADEATDDAPDFGQPTLRTNRVQGFIPFSYELGQDWGGLQGTLSVMLADAKDEEESASFILGDGIGTNAGGIVTTLAGASAVTTIGNDAFAVGDLYKLEEAVPPRYRARASFLANRFIYNKVRQFDTAGGASLWVRLADALGAELLNYPTYEASAMAASVADATKIMLLGDFKNFLIVDKVGMSIELIPHLFGGNGRPTGQRGIFAFWRNNSKILVDNAFRLLKIQ